MEGGLDYDRSQSEVGQNTLKAEAHGNRGHGPLLSQVTGGRPGMLGDNVDPGASAVHQVGLLLAALLHTGNSPQLPSNLLCLKTGQPTTLAPGSCTSPGC